MTKLGKKKLILLPIIAIIGLFVCIYSVKNNVLNIVTSTVMNYFDQNEEELIKEAALNSGFEDINLYTTIIDSYNKLDHKPITTNNIEQVTGTISYIGGFSNIPIEENNTVTFTNGTVEYYGVDSTVGRNQPGNRVGIRINTPENLEYEVYKNAKIVRINYYEDKTEVFKMIFDNVKDSETHYESWPVVTEKLNKVEILIDWNNNGNYQKYTLVFGENITLNPSPEEKPSPSETTSYSHGNLSYIGGFSNTPIEENNTVTFTNGTVEYYGVDSTVGRNQPGNRVGIRINTPENLEYEVYKNAKIIRINYYKDRTQVYEMTFDSVKDSKTHYESWPVVTYDLEKVEILIDWENKGIFDKFQMKFNSDIKLKKSPEEHKEYKDGINNEELSQIIELNASEKAIASTKGIEKLTNLKSLDLSNNNLTSIDLSNNTMLESLKLTGNNFQKDITLYKNTTNPDISKYNNDNIKLPVQIKNELINIKVLDNTYIVSYGEPSNEEIPSISIYEITYNIEYYEYENENYLFNDSKDTIYSLNNDFYIDEMNPEITEKILDNRVILRQENNHLDIFDNENNLLKTFNLEKIEITSAKYDLSKNYIYTNELDIANDIIIKSPEDENIEKQVENNKLIIKLNDKELLSKDIIRINSEKYDITDSYIFTSLESLDVMNIRVSEGIILTQDSNQLVISYQGEEIRRLEIKNITSSYDLSSNYFLTSTSAFLEELKYDESLVKVVEENSTIKLYYKENELNTYYFVKIENPYTTNDGNIYSNFNEKVDISKIIVINGTVKQENNEIIIAKNNNEIVAKYNIIEPSYEIPYIKIENNIYIGTDYEASKIVTNNVTKVIDGNKLILESSSGEKVEYNLYSLSSNYNLDDKYIYTGLNEFNNDFTSSHENMIREKGTSIEIYMNDIKVDEYKIISLKISEYTVDNNKIYTKLNDFDLSKVTITNGDKELFNNKLSIKYENIILDTYEIVTTIVSSETYDLSKPYIYTELSKLDLNAIKVTNGHAEINSSNQLVIKDLRENDLRKYDIISIFPTKETNIKISGNTIYTENYELNNKNITDNLTISNAKLSRVNNTLKIQYAGDYLAELSLVSLTTKYDLTKEYIFTKGTEKVAENITVTAPTNVVIYKLEENSKITIKQGVTEIFTRNIENINSNDYDITNNYIFTGPENINLNKIIKSKNININVDEEEKELVVSYKNKEIERLPIENIASSKYDLTNNYIELGTSEIELSKIKYNKNLVTVENKNNILSFQYKDKIYTYYLVSIDNPYIIKNGNIYTKFNEKFDSSKVKYSNSTIAVKNNKLIIKYGNKEEKYNIVEPTYILPYDYSSDYLYVGTDKNVSLLKINHGTINIEDNKLILTSDSGEKVTYPIYYIESTKYDLNNNYIYTGNKTLNLKEIKTSRDEMLSLDNDTLNIKVNNVIKASYKIISISSTKYDLNKENIYTGFDDLDISNIEVINAKLDYTNDTLTIKYDNKELAKYNVIKSSIIFNNYKLTDNYIYTSNNNFNIEKDIMLINATGDIKNNKLIISNKEGIIATYDIVTITKSPDLTKKYIYTEYEDLKLSDITVSNGSAEINNNYLVIKKDNTILESFPIVTINSKVDLTKEYVYTKQSDFKLSNITVTNGTREVSNNQLIIKYKNEVLKTIYLPKISFKNVNVKANNILISEKMDYNDFMSRITCTLVDCIIVSDNIQITSGSIENNMYLKVMYNGEEIDKYTITVDYLEMSNITTDESKNFIYNIKTGTKVNDLIKNISTSGTITVVDQNNKVLESNATLATGYKLKIKLNNTTVEYTIIIKGDIMGHGKVNVGDVGTLFLYLRNKIELDECYIEAGDVAGNKGISVADVGTVFLYIRGKINNLEE